jgi:hypothetical protein
LAGIAAPYQSNTSKKPAKSRQKAQSEKPYKLIAKILQIAEAKKSEVHETGDLKILFANPKTPELANFIGSAGL